MTQLQYATDASPGGAMVSDDSSRATSLTYATNMHGFAELRAHVPVALSEAFERFGRAGLPHQRVNDGAETVYEGRLEDVAIASDGVNASALGYSRALSDAPYTALWSLTDVTQFRPTRADETARAPERYTCDTNNRIGIALQKNATYASGGGAAAGMVYQKPDASSRQIIGVSFDAVVSLPLNWIFFFNTWQSGWTGGVNTTVVTGNGGTQVAGRLYTVSACDYLEFGVYNNTGGAYTNVNESDAWVVRITNVRLVTATTNMISTTTTAAITAGSNVNLPVGSSARMYVGMRLAIDTAAIGGTTSQGATVTAVPDATHVTIDTLIFSAGVGGVTVKAFILYADEIVRDLVSVMSTLNPTQLSSAVARVQSPAVDLFDEVYDDQLPSDILTSLIALGDNQTPPRLWEWAVWEGRVLTFQPRGATARTWYIDVAAPNIERTLVALFNSVYASYQESGGRTLRTAASSDSASIARYGLTRRKMIGVQTTSATQAGVQQAAALLDAKDPIPRAEISTDAIFDQNGARWPLTAVRAGDTVFVRNLPPTLSTTIDRVRTFRLIRTELDLFSGTLRLEPESPLPSLDAMLALATPPAWVTAPWWVQRRQ